MNGISSKIKGKTLLYNLRNLLTEEVVKGENIFRRKIKRFDEWQFHGLFRTLDFPVAQMVKNLPAVQEMWFWSLGHEDPLEKGIMTPSSILAWRISRTEVPGRLQQLILLLLLGCHRDKTGLWSLYPREHLCFLLAYFRVELSVQFSSVTQFCLTLCNPMDCRMPGLLVHHQLPELTQTQVDYVSDASHLSHPLSSPSSPAFNCSQSQGLFQWVSSSHEVAKVLVLQLQHQSFQWIFMTDFP